ncbi:acyltransferase [Algibacter sp.]|nr:acyltransferase [Algibacter sp.]
MNFIFIKIYDHLVIKFKKPIWAIVNFLILKFSNITYQEFPKIDGLLIIKNRGKIRIGKKVIINSSRYGNPVGNLEKTTFFCSPKGNIKIGNHVAMSRVLMFSQNSISIEDYVMIGGGVQIWDTDFHPINFEDRIINDISKIRTNPVLLKKGAFVGANSIILKGVTIGENSVIAAGSVVSKNIPCNEIWGGNPARLIKKM